LLDLTLKTVEENVALDEALLIQADGGNGPAILRFWESPRFAVVLGATRRMAEEVFLDACKEDAVPVLRRASGGGTVVIGPGALNLTVVMPTGAAPGLSSVEGAQRFVLERTAAALRASAGPIDVLGSGDLTLLGRKFAGSAQRRLRHWFLVHTSLLYDFPLDRISRYLKLPPRQPTYRAGRTHNEFLRNLALPRRIIRELILSAWCPSTSLAATTDVPHTLLESLLAARFANRSWIERF
jgi:lipoate-protein ligase A